MWTVHKPAWNNSPNCPLFSASCSPSYLLCACLLSHSPYPLSLSSGVPPKLQGWWSGTKPHRSISTHTLWHWLEPCQWPPGFYTQHFITHDKWIFFIYTVFLFRNTALLSEHHVHVCMLCKAIAYGGACFQEWSFVSVAYVYTCVPVKTQSQHYQCQVGTLGTDLKKVSNLGSLGLKVST